MTGRPPPARAARRRFRDRAGLRSGLWLTWAGSVSQVAPLAAAPALTRIYDPREFGIYAAVAIAVGILSLVAAGRYDMAIVLAGSPRDAVLLVALCRRIAAASCLLAGVVAPVVWLAPGAGDFWHWLPAVPALTLITAWGNALTQYAIRLDAVRTVFYANLVKALVVVSLQISLGLLGFGVGGLLAAAGAAAGAGYLWMLPGYRAGCRQARAAGGRLTGHRAVARAYKRFPRGDVVASLLNSGAGGVAVFGMAAVFSPTVVGWYSLANRVGALPATTVGAAVGRVYYRQAARLAAAGLPLRRRLRRTAGLTALIGAPGFAVALLWGPDLFALGFGEQWREAGRYLIAMAPLLWIRFAVSPISATLLIVGRHAVNVVWHVVFLTVTVAGLVAAATLELSPLGYLWCNTALVGAAYLVLFRLADGAAEPGRTGSSASPPPAPRVAVSSPSPVN